MHRFARQALAACSIAASLAAAHQIVASGSVVQGSHQRHTTPTMPIVLSVDQGRGRSLPCAGFTVGCIPNLRPYGLCLDLDPGAVDRRAAPACYALLRGVHPVHFH
jgi:hypothetical protein